MYTNDEWSNSTSQRYQQSKWTKEDNKLALYYYFKSNLMLYSHIIHMHACRNISNTIRTSGHGSLEKYTSHFIERVVCERELETEQRLQHIDPPAPPAKAVRLFQPGTWGPSLSAESWFQQLDLEHWLQALNSNCLTSCLTRVISLFYVHSIQPVDSQGYLLISSTGCTCYLHRCISHLTAWSGRRSICNTHTKRDWKRMIEIWEECARFKTRPKLAN